MALEPNVEGAYATVEAAERMVRAQSLRIGETRQPLFGPSSPKQLDQLWPYLGRTLDGRHDRLVVC